MKTIILNSKNSTSDVSKFTYKFPTTINFPKHEIALVNASVFYSWNNITSAYANNKFSYVWPVGNQTVNITIPDGFYTTAQINAYLQSIMVSNGHYLISGSNYVYYLELIENPSLYAIQLNSYPIPSVLPAGYSAPANWPGYPALASTPQFVVVQNDFTKIIGFNVGTYPTIVQASSYSKTSDFTPQISPVSSVILSCSLVDNKFSIPADVFFCFTPDKPFGSLLDIRPYSFSWNEIAPGSYGQFDVVFYDQNFNLLKLKDTQIVIILAIRERQNQS